MTPRNEEDADTLSAVGVVGHPGKLLHPRNPIGRRGALRPDCPASSVTLAASLRQPPAFPCGQSVSSADWVWLNGSGGIVPSSVAWMSAPAVRAASPLTHCPWGCVMGIAQTDKGVHP